MIEVKNLCKDYISKNGEVVHALQDLSIRLPSSGMLFILGKSGSGKSTLLNVLSGLDTFDKGDIIICGKSSKQFSREDWDAYRNTYVGFIFQDFHLLDDFTVKENILLALEIQAKEVQDTTFAKLMQDLEIDELEGRNTGELSGGQKQRVAIARALIKDPQILFADEPTGNLDSKTSTLLLDYLQAQSKDRLIVVVTHDRAGAEKYADRLIELKDGKIIKDSNRVASTCRHIEWEEDGAILGKDSLAQKDLAYLNELLADKKKIIIKKGESTHFVATRVEKVSANLNFQPYRSFLPLDKNIKISSKHIKSKKIRLTVTILLIILSLTLLGLAQIVSDYNITASTASGFDNYNINNVRLKQGRVEKTGFFIRRDDVIQDATYQKIKADLPDINFLEYYPLLGLELRRYRSYALLDNQLSGIVVADSKGVESLGFTIVGRPPQEQSREVMITDYTLLGLLVADATIILPISDPTKLTTAVLTKLNALNVTSSEVHLINLLLSGEIEEFVSATSSGTRTRIMDIIAGLACNYDLRLSRYTFRISGIIRTGAEEFFPLLADGENLNYTTQAMRLKFNRTNYYHNLYVGKGFIEKLYENAIYAYTNYGDIDIASKQTYDGPYMAQLKERIERYIADNDLGEEYTDSELEISYFNGYDSSTQLKKGEILVSEHLFVRNFKTDLSDIGLPFEDCPRVELAVGMGRQFPNIRSEYPVKIVGVIRNKRIANADGVEQVFSPSYAIVTSEALLEEITANNTKLTSLFFALPTDTAARAEVIKYISDSSNNGNQVYHLSIISEVFYLIGDVLYITKSLFRLASLVIGLFSIILLANFMVSAVYDKRREIGILRALGCTNKNISILFLTQAIFIGFLAMLGATITIILGVHVINILFVNNFAEYFDTFMVKDLTLLRLGVAPFAIVYALVGAMVFLATYIPIKKVGKLTPIDAIR